MEPEKQRNPRKLQGGHTYYSNEDWRVEGDIDEKYKK